MNNKICVLTVLAACIGLLLTGFSAGQLEKSATVYFSGIVQQTSTPSPLNAIWMEHPDTDFLNQNQQAIVQNLLDSNIKIVFVQIGNWLQFNNATAGIVYWYNSSVIEDTINSIHSYSNNQIQVYAWMYCSNVEGEPGGLVNLTNPGIRQQCAHAAANCVQTYGFDGFNDDLYEPSGYLGNDTDYVAFVNALGTAMSGVNKISSCDLSAAWNDTDYPTLYGGITTVNYICPMLYGGYNDGSWGQSGITYNLNQALTYSNVHVLAGVYVSPYPNNITLTDILGWIGHPSNSKFSGVSIFNLAFMQSGDWASLTDWVDGDL